jgi:predicted DNA-binding protein (MmcQ/YjbR family)
VFTLTVGKNLSGQKQEVTAGTDQQAFIQRLNAAREAFWFSLAAYALLTQDPARSAISGFSVKVDDHDFRVIRRESEELTPGRHSYRVNFIEDVSEPAAREVVHKAFEKMITDSFELVRAYAKSHDLEKEMRGQSWYRFARIYRNALSHDKTWPLDNKDPVRWRNLIVNIDMEGQPVRGFLSWMKGLQLGAEMTNFVANHPSRAPQA